MVCDLEWASKPLLRNAWCALATSGTIKSIIRMSKAAVLLNCVSAEYQVRYTRAGEDSNGFAERLLEPGSSGGFSKASSVVAKI
jgi:hypothetical protein